jgi:hypothetical protein
VKPAGLVHARRQSGERSSPDPGDSPDPDSTERDRSRICLAEGEPAEALGAVQPVLDGVAPIVGNVSVRETHDMLAEPRNCQDLWIEIFS